MRMKLSKYTSRRVALLVGAFIVVGLGTGAAVALSAGSGQYVPGLGATVPANKVTQVQHALPKDAPESSVPAPAPTGKPDRIPAAMLPSDTPIPLSPQLIHVTNAWLVSDGKTLVAVYAGSAGNDATEGRFVIVRQNLEVGKQTQDVVNVHGSGAVSITDAPRGAAVEASAQRGRLGFRGAAGASGSLDLATDAAG